MTMRPLNPLSTEDRRHTAYTELFFIKELERGAIRAGINSFDCWGKQQGWTHMFTTTREYLKKYGGWKSHITLSLLQRGCCPPLLRQGFVETKEAPG